MSVPGSVTFKLEKQQKPFGKFLQGEPKLLGITLIMFAGMHFGFGFAIHFGAKSFSEYLGVNWWISLMVTACVAMNIVNAVFATLGVFFYVLNIVDWLTDEPVTTDKERRHHVLKFGLHGFLTVVLVTGLVINVTLSVFCCRGLRYCRPSSSVPVVMVSAPLSDNPTVVSN